MDEKRWAKRLLTTPTIGKRPQGRPPKKFYNINFLLMSRLPRTTKITIQEALDIAQDRKAWRLLCNSLVPQRIDEDTQFTNEPD